MHEKNRDESNLPQASQPTNSNWETVSNELKAYRAQQRETWGEVDPSTIGQYLANEIGDHEREEVEEALDEHPELRRLTDLVREVLSDCDPIETAPEEPTHKNILGFPGSKRPSRTAHWKHVGSLVAAACLLFMLGIGLLETIRATPEQHSESVAMLDNSRDTALRVHRVGDNRTLSEVEAKLSLMDETVLKLQEQKRDKEALQVSLQYAAVANRVKAENHPRYAKSLELVGDLYKKTGKIEQAERTYRQAWSISKKKLGDDAEQTVGQLNQLAKIYTEALDQPAFKTNSFKVAEGGLGSAGAPPLALTEPKPPGHVRSTPPTPAAPNQADTFEAKSESRIQEREKFGDKLFRRKPKQLGQDVVPILRDAVAKAKTSRQRIGYVSALTQLGPAAKDAAPVLVKCLEQSKDSTEQVVLLQALGNLGPTAHEVLPTLERYLQVDDAEVRRVAARGLLRCGPQGRALLRKSVSLTRAKRDMLLRVVTDELQRPEFRYGIVDNAQVMTPALVHRTERQLADLVARKNLVVFIETVSEAPKAEPDMVGSRAALLGAHGIYLLLDDKTNEVHLSVSEQLRKQGFSEEMEQRLRDEVTTALNKDRYDSILRSVVRSLSRYSPPSP